MNWEDANDALGRGRRVRRAGWTYIRFVATAKGPGSSLFAEYDDGERRGFVPSMEERQATDWEIVG